MEILSLRYQQAQMHGYNSFADFNTSDTMAGSPEKVMELLEMVWEPAKLSAQREKDALLQFIEASPGLDKLTSVEPWDWRYLAEKVSDHRVSDFTI
jgi:peptidyl-dipeptidase Dcp